MLKRLVYLLLLFPLFSSTVLAQTGSVQRNGASGVIPPVNDKIFPIPPVDNFGVFGQDHFYTVVFRGNGEAVVTFKSILTNTLLSPLSTIELGMPKVKATDVLVYQAVKDPQCVRYLPNANGNNPESCAEYQEPDYRAYYGGTTHYYRATYETKGDLLVITLPKPIDSNKSGSFMMYYRSLGYTSKDFLGKYTYKFETLKINDKIRNLQVGVDVDSDLKLKGATGKVAYNVSDAETSLKAVNSATGAIQNPQVDQFYQSIGQGRLYKNAQDLKPQETYIVKGSYAESDWMLYGKEILVSIVIGIFLLVIAILGVRFAYRRLGKRNDKQVNEGKEMGSFIESGILSFAASFLILGFTFLLYILINSSNSGLNTGGGTLIFLLGVVLSAGIYIILFLTPVVVVGVRHAWVYGLVTLGMTLLFLLFYFILIVFVFVIFRNNPSFQPPIMPLSYPQVQIQK